MFLHFFVIISDLKTTWPLICRILNYFYLRLISTKFASNWPAGSREDFKKINECLLILLSPLGNGIVLHLYYSESPLPKNDLCQLWVKLAKRFLRRSRKCKFLDVQIYGQTTDKGDQKTSLELSAQVS
jgi:hypothetical protein